MSHDQQQPLARLRRLDWDSLRRGLRGGAFYGNPEAAGDEECGSVRNMSLIPIEMAFQNQLFRKLPVNQVVSIRM